MEHIVKERKEWRDTIRKLTTDLYGSNPDYKKIRASFEIRLNPKDEKDKNILNYLDDITHLNILPNEQRLGYNG